ncbi:MAG: type II toxin-antitoxin system RelE/ParE family toxin [Gammaproteobacteria bacterium]|nr:type II toxin-antitoxin system RelE/ParE family toxin [Gammaproteobacteria bacterium]
MPLDRRGRGTRREASFQLDKVQRGQDPDDWKPLATVGPGVREIRIREASGAFRVIYVANFGAFIHVLHAFRKSTPKTSRRDLQLARARLEAIRSRQ